GTARVFSFCPRSFSIHALIKYRSCLLLFVIASDVCLASAGYITRVAPNALTPEDSKDRETIIKIIDKMNPGLFREFITTIPLLLCSQVYAVRDKSTRTRHPTGYCPAQDVQK